MSTLHDQVSLSEKHHNEQVEQVKPSHHNASDDDNTFEIEEEALPKGYFTSPFFIGTMTGICLGLVAGVAGFGYIAPILPLINADIGPVCFPLVPPSHKLVFANLASVSRMPTSSGSRSPTPSPPPSASPSSAASPTSSAVAGSSSAAPSSASSAPSSAPSPPPSTCSSAA